MLFIVLMLGNQLMSNSAVRERQAGAMAQADAARAAAESKSAARGLQIGALNIRFANTDEELATAKDYLAVRVKAFFGLCRRDQAAVGFSRDPRHNREAEGHDRPL